MKKPDLNDYGLSIELINSAESKNKVIEKYTNIAILILSISLSVIPVIGYNIYIWNTKDLTILLFISMIIMSLFAVLFLSFLFMFFFSMINTICNSIWGSKVLKNNEKYKEALIEYEKNVYKQKKEFWYSLNGYQFEQEIEKLLKKVNYNVLRTKGSGDEGIDLIINDNIEGEILVQCKAYKNQKIGPAPVRELLGVITSRNLNKGIIICLSGASINASKFAKENNIDIWNVHKLIRIQEEYFNKN